MTDTIINVDNDEIVKSSTNNNKKKPSPKPKKAASTSKIKPDAIALWSNANLFKRELGSLSKGPNIVSKEAADDWLTHRAVRIASPEEIAAYYQGK